MSAIEATPSLRARATHILNPLHVSKVLCHRRKEGREQFFIRWKTVPEFPVPPRAPCSWHGLDELGQCLHLVQKYLDTCSRPISTTSALNGHAGVKRKRDAGATSRDARAGNTFTPLNAGRSPSTVTASASSDVSADVADITVYNAVLQRKEGWLVAERSKRKSVPEVNATKLPTPEMLEQAAKTPVDETERHIRAAFHRKVETIPKLYLENNIDKSTPSLNFKFIKDYVLGQDVYRPGSDTYEGCGKKCRGNMGPVYGCQFPRDCDCLEYAAVNEDALMKENPKLFQEYKRATMEGEYIDTTGLPKRFPYLTNKEDNRPQRLVPFYREQRHAIYECNVNCGCGPMCKSRVVQKGRKLPLTIFKTTNRGWGVYCNEDLVVGEFIDTYLGEIVTSEEADRREKVSSKDKQSYLYSLDKFVGDDLAEEDTYVVDGQHMGGPSRFMNHSCEPNCRQYTVSYNKHDPRLYDIAFFAQEDIPAGTELTFDYVDADEEEEDVAIRRREVALRDPGNVGRQPCNCGARKCRGYLWT